ncbi:MAG: DUF5681 domain-containing protein [Terricaulis sp.]
MSDHDDEKPAISIRVRRRPGVAPEPSPAASNGEDDEHSYKVGYRRPPIGTRFAPGRSGNPKGRPKGSKNWSTVMTEAASRTRTIGVGGKKVRMSGSEAIAEQLVINAIKGDAKSRRDFLNEMRFDRQREAAMPSAGDQTSEPLSANDKALLDDFFKRARAANENESS